MTTAATRSCAMSDGPHNTIGGEAQARTGKDDPLPCSAMSAPAVQAAVLVLAYAGAQWGESGQVLVCCRTAAPAGLATGGALVDAAHVVRVKQLHRCSLTSEICSSAWRRLPRPAVNARLSLPFLLILWW